VAGVAGLAPESSTATSTADVTTVEIRTSLALCSVYILLFGFFIGLAAHSFYTGSSYLDELSIKEWLIWIFLAAIFLLLIGAAIDRRPVVVLSADGIWDRRVRPALIRWQDIKRAEAYSFERWGGGGLMGTYRIVLHLQRGLTGPKFRGIGRLFASAPTGQAHVILGGLEVEPAQFVDLMKRFAPDLPVDTSLLEIR
jgi:hypothetical protein